MIPERFRRFRPAKRVSGNAFDMIRCLGKEKLVDDNKASIDLQKENVCVANHVEMASSKRGKATRLII